MGAPSPKKAKKDAAALIAARKKASRSVLICMRSDLRAEVQALSSQLIDAEDARQASGSLASGTITRALAEQIDALQNEMQEATVRFVVQAMPRREWRALALANPPRDGINTVGVNEEVFFDTAIRYCCVEPELPTEAWDELLTECSEAEWVALRDAVRLVNERDLDVPFSKTASRILQASETS